MSFDPKKINLFPTQPGVYLMKDIDGNVLYVGKAKNLRARIKQYFSTSRDERLMIPFLVAKVEFVDTIIVSSEKEALLLENNLIKQHKPRYNALLKDDKTYIALKISINDPWPTIQIVRYRGQPKPDGLYFGPYTSAKAARQTLDLLHRLFPLRQCSDIEFARRVRPCLLFQLKKCAAPCVQQCTKEEYHHHLQRTIRFLKGEDKEVLKDLYNEMQRLSEELEFERAGHIFSTIQYLEKTIETQYVDRPLGVSADALGMYRYGSEVMLVQLLFRHGRLTGSRHFDFHNIVEEDNELIASFLLQHYEKQVDVPKEIIIPFELSEKQSIEEILSAYQSHKISLTFPQRGEKKVLMEMARVNAEGLFKSQKSEESLREKTLLEMQELLFLTHYPVRIECFDNSTHGGTESVSSMVTFTNGIKDKKRYRLYKLRKQNEEINDYGAMEEVLLRRYKRAKEENDLPDLVIVDGGKGHLHLAKKILEELNITGVDIVGVAKEQSRHDKGMSEEQIFLINQPKPLILKSNSPILFLMQSIRDEAHRVAISFHRNRFSKKTIQSALDKISGIGPAKRKALLIHFGSIKKIQQATEEELKKLSILNPQNIAAILEFFKNP